MLATLIYQRNLKKNHYLNFNNIQFLLQNIESNNIFKTKITEFVNQPFQSNFINLFTQL